MATKVCGLCCFWEETRDDAHGILGDCRIDAPRPIRKGPNPGRGVWPETYGYDWCGRWQEAEEDDA